MYKVMLVGKTGVGKTSTVAKLTGADVPLSHNETPGEYFSVGLHHYHTVRYWMSIMYFENSTNSEVAGVILKKREMYKTVCKLVWPSGKTLGC